MIDLIGTLRNLLLEALGISARQSADMVLYQAFNTTVTAPAGNVQLFQLDAISGPKKDIRFGFYLAADALATFTVFTSKTRSGDLVTLNQDLSKTWTLATPAAGWHTYDIGDLEEGLQMTFNVGQVAGGADVIDATLTYLG